MFEVRSVNVKLLACSGEAVAISSQLYRVTSIAGGISNRSR
jgi:hypothetical protein